jgi:hypothetical protein
MADAPLAWMDHELPQSPVRDDEKLGPTEDLDRQPDGIPHLGIGLTAAAAVASAIAMAILLIQHRWVLIWLPALALVFVIVAFSSWSDSRRDQMEHPSR